MVLPQPQVVSNRLVRRKRRLHRFPRLKTNNVTLKKHTIVTWIITLCITILLIYQYLHNNFHLRNIHAPSIITTTNGNNQTTPNDDGRKNSPLPAWISSYVKFHKQTRQKYPGLSLFTDPTAPKLLIRICTSKGKSCGGLTDRLGNLPLDLYMANQTGRILLIYWHYPHRLENYFEPNEIDWSFPKDVKFWSPDVDGLRMQDTRPINCNSIAEGLSYAERWDKEEVKRNFWYLALGHLMEDELEERLRALGETDMIHNTPTYGRLFRMFFKPSPPVERLVKEARRDMGLREGETYSAVHCRVRHVRGMKKGAKGKDNWNHPDGSGLIFSGDDKDFAVSVATHAIRCAATLLLPSSSHPPSNAKKNSQEPIYFFSDSEDLVNFIISSSRDDTTTTGWNMSNPIDQAARDALSSLNVVSRRSSLPNLHLDKQSDYDIDAYYPIFVDFLLAVGARCMTYGVGNFARFATKVAGTSCRLRHRREVWGFRKRMDGKGWEGNDRVCVKEDYETR